MPPPPLTEPAATSETGSAPPGFREWLQAIAVAVLPWLALLVLVRPLATPEWPPFGWSGSLSRWVAGVFGDVGFFVPFLLFAGGSALVRVVGLSRRLVRIAVVVGIFSGVLAYGCTAIFMPTLVHRTLAERLPDIEEVLPFGPDTPAGLVRNLRFVEQNPPTEFSLSTNQSQNRPPEVLLWELHRPIALAVFGIINLFLGALAAEATVRMDRPGQWNTRLAIGVAGAIVFYLLQEMGSPIQSFLRGDPMGSGALAAWGPMALPVAEALLFGYLVWKRRR